MVHYNSLQSDNDKDENSGTCKLDARDVISDVKRTRDGVKVIGSRGLQKF